MDQPQSQAVTTVCIGIDWADQLHAFHLTGFDGEIDIVESHHAPEVFCQVADVDRDHGMRGKGGRRRASRHD